MKLLPFLFIAFIVGCSQAPASPTCRIAKAFNADYKGPSACLIRVDDTLMVVKHTPSGLYDLPSGDPIAEESAQCTAHRHTWEQTGMNVEVDLLLGVTQSGIMLFSCSTNSGFTSEDGPLPPPDWTDGDIQQIEFINPFDTRYDAWLRPNNLIMYRDGFIQTNNSQFPQVPAQSQQNLAQ